MQTEVDVIAVGRVLDEGRGSLPYALVHGEALVAAATWALSAAGVLPIDARTSLGDVLDGHLPLVLHDALCPMTPPAFIAACVRRAAEEDLAVAAVRPVTDTVKVLDGDLLGATVDRDALARVVSPVVVPARLLEDLALDDLSVDLADLVTRLGGLGRVLLVEAPPEAMRVSDAEDLRVLEALTRPS
jgi:2-C-methyl-D-erythritol 4-phosphate cytidylyltransferase